MWRVPVPGRGESLLQMLNILSCKLDLFIYMIYELEFNAGVSYFIYSCRNMKHHSHKLVSMYVQYLKIYCL